jgi:hypothetical protein
MARPLPKKGFYTWNCLKWAKAQKLPQDKIDKLLSSSLDINVIYSSGTTKGNFYYEPVHHDDQWNALTWTCLPSVKEAEAHYDFSEENTTPHPIPTQKAG